MAVSKEAIIQLESGVHAKPAADFVQLANRFPCKITITKDEKTVNGKSIMGLMMLALTKGSKITITADGEKEGEALSELVRFVENNFTV
ncbi:MAG: HPr family phosphocarrier protein [Candidatus Hydrogenedentota bacterium]|nr:MAG: HPr family phosphocarrier protein [Candidatus Hydrogenedentota bacterium]